MDERSGLDWKAPVRFWLASLRFQTGGEDEWIHPSATVSHLHGNRSPDMSCCFCFHREPDRDDDIEPVINDSPVSSVPKRIKRGRPPPLAPFALSRISEGPFEPSSCAPLHFAELRSEIQCYELLPASPSHRSRRSYHFPQKNSSPFNRFSWPSYTKVNWNHCCWIVRTRFQLDEPVTDRSLSKAYAVETLTWTDASVLPSLDEAKTVRKRFESVCIQQPE